MFYIIFQYFVYFFALNTGQSWSWSRPFFHGFGSSQKSGSGSTTMVMRPVFALPVLFRLSPAPAPTFGLIFFLRLPYELY